MTLATSHMVRTQEVTWPTCSGNHYNVKWSADRREREAQQFEHCEERQNREEKEEYPVLNNQPCLPPEAMVKSQPVLTVKAMSGFVATQWQGYSVNVCGSYCY